MRNVAVFLVCSLFLAPVGAVAQSTETLADIRQELTVLFVELQKLKRELSTTGGVSQPSGGGSLVDRVNAIESEVQRLTAKTEDLEFRIDRVVTDGTNRVGDLEFRLCELEPGCDVSKLEPGSTLGGITPATGGGTALPTPPVINAPQPATENAPQLAAAEQADFDRARAALEAGDNLSAAEQFAAFRNAYPGGPLSARAGLLQGEALEAAGQHSDAARAYLDTFSAAQDPAEASEALFRLGRSLGILGQTQDACLTLAQVETRYPAAAVVESARQEMSRLGCS